MDVSVTLWYYFEKQGCWKVAEIQKTRNSTKQLGIEEQKKEQGCLCHGNDFAGIGVGNNILKSYIMGVKDYQIFINKLKNKIYAEKSFSCSLGTLSASSPCRVSLRILEMQWVEDDS